MVIKMGACTPHRSTALGSGQTHNTHTAASEKQKCARRRNARREPACSRNTETERGRMRRESISGTPAYYLHSIDLSMCVIIPYTFYSIFPCTLWLPRDNQSRIKTIPRSCVYYHYPDAKYNKTKVDQKQYMWLSSIGSRAKTQI